MKYIPVILYTMPFSSSTFLVSSSNDPSITYQWIVGSNNSLELEKHIETGDIQTKHKILKFEVDDDDIVDDSYLIMNPTKGMKTINNSDTMGKAKIGSTMEPAMDNMYSVGMSNSRFADAFFGGTISCSNMIIGNTPLDSYPAFVPNDSVVTAKMADGSVTTAKIATGAVDSSKLLAGTITSSNLASGAVATTNLADGSVTSAKLASSLSLTSNMTVGGNFEVNGQIRANSNDNFTTPSYSWSNDSNTGMYHASTQSLGFSCGGSNVMSLDSNLVTIGNPVSMNRQFYGPFCSSYVGSNSGINSTKWGIQFFIASLNNSSNAGYSNNNPLKLTLPTPGIYSVYLHGRAGTSNLMYEATMFFASSNDTSLTFLNRTPIAGLNASIQWETNGNELNALFVSTPSLPASTVVNWQLNAYRMAHV